MQCLAYHDAPYKAVPHTQPTLSSHYSLTTEHFQHLQLAASSSWAMIRNNGDIHCTHILTCLSWLIYANGMYSIFTDNDTRLLVLEIGLSR